MFKIRFDSDSAYEIGVETLLINVCGNRFGTIRVTLNGENIITLMHAHPAYRADNITSWENSDYMIYAGNIYDAIRLDIDEALDRGRGLQGIAHKDLIRCPVLCGRHPKPMLKRRAEDTFTGETGLIADILYGEFRIL